MSRIFSFITLLALLLTSQVASAADKATTILDKSAAMVKKAGNVNIGFNLTVEGQSTMGYIKLSGNRFCCSMGNTMTWFNGTTMWHYVKDNEEVNVTTPTAAEVARMNPYSFLTLYKKGYDVKLTKSTSSEHYITLTGKHKSAAYVEIQVHINKTSYQPTYIKLTTSRRSTEIKVNSFLKNQNYSDATFRFNKKDYPNAEIVDLR